MWLWIMQDQLAGAYQFTHAGECRHRHKDPDEMTGTMTAMVSSQQEVLQEDQQKFWPYLLD